MPKNYTENYQLNQWEPTDPVLRRDFNADNEKLDAALAAKAEQSALESLKQTVSSLSGTVSQHTGAMEKLGDCRLYTTSYTGNGAGGAAGARSLTFPSRPYLVVITGKSSLFVLTPGITMGVAAYATKNIENIVSWNGNSVSWHTGDNLGAYMMNAANQTYQVLALLKAG